MNATRLNSNAFSNATSTPQTSRPATGRRAFLSLTLATILVSCSGPATFAQPASPKQPPTSQQLTEIQGAIQQLGSGDSEQRSAAEIELRKFAELAISELDKAAQFETTLDHEVQLRAVELLRTLRESQAKAVAEQFIAGKATLTGWPEFNAICGNDEASRELYHDIHTRYAKQIETSIRQPQNLTHVELTNLFGSRDRERIAMGLFLLTHSNKRSASTVPKQQIEVLARNLLGNAGQFLKAKQKHQSSMVRLVCAFLESSPKLAPARKLALLITIEHPLVDLQLLELADPKFPPLVRAIAIANLSNNAAPSTLTRLEQHFDDTTSVGKYLIDVQPQKGSRPSRDQPNAPTPVTRQTVAEVQIRDLCLLAGLRIAKKTPTDFGFPANALGKSPAKIDIKKAGFADDITRKKAFKLWYQTQENRLPNEQ